MKKSVLFLSSFFFALSAIAQSQLALEGQIVSMPTTIKVSAEKKDLDPRAFGSIVDEKGVYKLAYRINTDFIRLGMVFQNQKIVWLTYGGAQAGPKYLGQLREDFEFIVQTTTGLRKTVIVRAPSVSHSKQFVSVFGSSKNGSGPISGIAINASDSSLVEIH